MKKQVLLSDINRRECKWQSILPILESMNYILGEYYHICDVVEIETQDGIDFDTIKCIGKPEEIKTISLGWGDPMVTSDYGYITLFSNGKVTLSWYDNVTQKGEDFEWASLIDAYKEASNHYIENILQFHGWYIDEAVMGQEETYDFIIKDNKVIFDRKKDEVDISMLNEADKVKELVLSPAGWSEYASALSGYYDYAYRMYPEEDRRPDYVVRKINNFKKIIDKYENK